MKRRFETIGSIAQRVVAPNQTNSSSNGQTRIARLITSTRRNHRIGSVSPSMVSQIARLSGDVGEAPDRASTVTSWVYGAVPIIM